MFSILLSIIIAEKVVSLTLAHFGRFVIDFLVVENRSKSPLVVLILVDVITDEFAEPDSPRVHFISNEVSPLAFLFYVFIPNLIHGLLILNFLHGIESFECSMLAEEPGLGYFIE